jgi:hypothetical protein
MLLWMTGVNGRQFTSEHQENYFDSRLMSDKGMWVLKNRASVRPGV